MPLRLDIAVNLGDAPGRVDDEAVALGELDQSERPERAVGLGDRAVAVG